MEKEEQLIQIKKTWKRGEYVNTIKVLEDQSILVFTAVQIQIYNPLTYRMMGYTKITPLGHQVYYEKGRLMTISY